MPKNVREKYFNQGHLDFSVDANDKALKTALEEVRDNFGKEYDLYING